MKEILFRGQTRKRGQKVNMAGEKLPGIWVYGGIFPGTGDYSVIYGDTDMNLSAVTVEKHIVWSDTVGQFTDRFDATKWEDLSQEEQEAFLHQPDGWENVPELWHGRMIFEGDIISYLDPDGVLQIGVIEFGQHGSGGVLNIGFFVKWWKGQYPEILRQDLGFWASCREVRVIGNIHDNPELLEVQDNV